MRILVAAIFGGIVMFLWGAVAHLSLGLGNPGIRQPVHEDAVLNVLHEGLGSKSGVYILPTLDPKQWNDPAVRAAYARKAASSPYAWVVYQPQGEDMTDMRRQLLRQWASDTLASLALASIMGIATMSFAKRIGVTMAVVAFAWLTTLVPYWNWYCFPDALIWAALVEQLVGWLLAGTVMAWWIGRPARKAG